jgi:hypothetical protein
VYGEARHRLNNHIENNAKLDRSAGCDVGVQQNLVVRRHEIWSDVRW